MKYNWILWFALSITGLSCGSGSGGEGNGDGNTDVPDDPVTDAPGTVLTRQNVYGLTATDPIIMGYKTAIEAMQALPASDQRSWTYQAAIHGTYTTPAQTAWNSCQHGSFFFLSWHRMYLYYFERIVRRYSGVNNWTLPYWNYSDPTMRPLPVTFRDPANASNPLFVQQRNPSINNGASLSPSTVVLNCLNFIPFTGTRSSFESFGGETIPAPQHFFSGTGALESVPHNVVHNAIGGWMRDPNTAAQDPIFWVHHCNIDRLWESWLALGNGRSNPTDMSDPADSVWLTTTFQFYDENATLVELTGQEIVNTATQLNYNYAELSPAPTITNTVAARPAPATMEQDPPMQLLAETPPGQETTLTLEPLTVSLNMAPDKNLMMRNSMAPENDEEEDTDAYLSIEGLSFDELPDQSFGVFLNVPAGETPDFNSVHYVNVITFFGIVHHAQEGHPINLLFPLEGTLQRLEEAGIDTSNLSVTFYPTSGVEPLAGDPPQALSGTPVGSPKIQKVSIVLK